MRKYYNNEKHFYYENNKNKKDDLISGVILTYIFNNINDFCELILNIRKQNNDHINNTHYRMLESYFSKDDILIDLNMNEDFLDFFYSLKGNNLYNSNSYKIRKDIFMKFYKDTDKYAFNHSIKNHCINVLLEELQNNLSFREYFKKNVDLDLYLYLSVEYPKLQKYCPNYLKEDLRYIIDALEN